jgi:hypothetical protein
MVAVLLAAAAAPARAATDAPDRSTDRPWAKAVSAEKQEEALRLFKEGNKLFEDSQHAAALARYREALAVWDHPAIRYNAAVALIQLDQPLAAHENLEQALRYGEAPIGAETYQQALTYRKLLVGQLAQLKVTCAERDADVTLDGMPLFVAPGEVSRWLLPGTHQLVARKQGFLPETRALSLLPGRPAVEDLSLQEIRSLPPRTVRRWPAWKPWAVVASGAALALIGLPLMLDARSNIAAYDAEVTKCAMNMAMMGCPPDDLSATALDARDRGRAENIVAVSLFTVGGIVAAGGAALVVLNQPRIVPAEAQLSLAPLLGPGQVGLSFAFQR